MVLGDTRILSSLEYWSFSRPQICSGDQSRPPWRATSLLTVDIARLRFGDHANRRIRRNPSGDTLSLYQLERSKRAMTHGRSNPVVLRQHKVNDPMVLAEGPPNLMQRLSQLPTAPHLGPLHRGKFPSSR